MHPTVGSSIGPYRLIDLIGQGGMGLVFLAEHSLIGKRAAVKVMRPELVAQSDVAARFINEARAVNTVRNDHIVDIFDAGRTPDGGVYCVMEWLEGESLQDVIKRGRLDFGTVVDVAVQISRALHACHEKNIIHRDLKPANLFVLRRGGAPFVKILDFGVAKLLGDDASSTHSNAIIGTPYYMPPEQCRGSRDLDRRVDVYALGVILYELCTGSLPFEGNSTADILIKQATEPPVDPRERTPELPRWMADTILKALEKDREHRFRDMEAFAVALENGEREQIPLPAPQIPTEASPPSTVVAPPPQLETGRGGATLNPSVSQRAARSGAEHVKSSVLVGLGLFVVVGVLLAAWHHSSSEATSAASAPVAPPVSAAAPAASSTNPSAKPPPPPMDPPRAPVTALAAEQEAPGPVVRPVEDAPRPVASSAPTTSAMEPTPAPRPSPSVTVQPEKPAPAKRRSHLETLFPP